jgi:hypothetical protein
MDQVAMETQLHYYKAFVETLVYRLSVTSARLSALRASNEAAKVQTATRSVAESESNPPAAEPEDITQPVIHDVTQPLIREGESTLQADKPDAVKRESQSPKQAGPT